MTKNWKNTSNPLIPAGTGAVFLICWEAIVRGLNVQDYIIPAPSKILITLVNQFPVIWPHLVVTVSTAVSGFVIAVVCAFIICAIMDAFSPVKKALYPFMVISQTIPLVFIYPLLMIWFGYGLFPKILVVIIVCVFPVAVNLMDGLTQTDSDLTNLLRSMKAGRWQIFTLLRLPGAMPLFFSGLKIAATYCIMGAVIGEWMGAQKGIGVYMIRSYKTFGYAKVFASIGLAVLLSLAVFGVVICIERVVLSWKFKQKESP